jgi:hypothetical protein
MIIINGIKIPENAKAIKLEPSPSLDKAIVAYDIDNDILVYDVETLIECYVEGGMTEEEAWDWYSYNTVRTGYYVKNYPRFIHEEN